MVSVHSGSARILRMNLNNVSVLGGRVLGLTLAGLFLVACGGKVFFNGEADGGGGSGGNGGNGGSPQGPGPGPGPGPTTTGPVPICDILCSQFPDCLGGENCQEVCSSFYVAGCEAESEAYLQCVANNFTPDCGFPEGACFSEINALESCQSQSKCKTDTCEGFEPNCYCTGLCESEFDEVYVEQSCYGAFLEGAPPDGAGGGGGGGDVPGKEMQCDCYVNGEYITTCFNGSFQCSLEQGCCQQFL